MGEEEQYFTGEVGWYDYSSNLTYRYAHYADAEQQQGWEWQLSWVHDKAAGTITLDGTIALPGGVLTLPPPGPDQSDATLVILP